MTRATSGKAPGPFKKTTATGIASEKSSLLIDAIIERAVGHVTSYVHSVAFKRNDDDDKHIQRAAESFVAVLNARVPQKNCKTGVRRVALSEDAIKSVFHLPISLAAQELGVGLTVLKKYCRVYEINRWPFRKLKSLDKLVFTVSSIDDSGSAIERSMVAQGLVDKKNQMHLEPSIELDREIKRIRQAAYKLEHRKRRENGAARDAAGTSS